MSHPREPVSPISQLLASTLAQSVNSALLSRSEVDRIGLRTTLHRRVERNGKIYLQQACEYSGAQRGGVGRIFGVDRGLMGAALQRIQIGRTRHFASETELRGILRSDMHETNDPGDPNTIPTSYVAIPFAHDSSGIAVLYSDCSELNFFANDDRLDLILRICVGFAELLDGLLAEPKREDKTVLRNIPFNRSEQSEPVESGKLTVYKNVQEWLAEKTPPRMKAVRSFNWEINGDL